MSESRGRNPKWYSPIVAWGRGVGREGGRGLGRERERVREGKGWGWGGRERGRGGT